MRDVIIGKQEDPEIKRLMLRIDTLVAALEESQDSIAKMNAQIRKLRLRITELNGQLEESRLRTQIAETTIDNSRSAGSIDIGVTEWRNR